MKKRLSEFIKTILLIIGAAVIASVIFSAIDYFSNGAILDYFAGLFSYETSYVDLNGQKWATQRINWQAVKKTVFILLIISVSLIVLITRSVMERRERIIRQELERKEWELDVESQKKNDLITYLAHDLKTPLTSVIGYLSLLDEAPDMPQEQRVKYTKIGLNKAFRLEALINEFFDITRYNLQEIELSREDVDISFLLMQMAEEFYPTLAEKKDEIKLDVPEQVMLFADPEKLARVFNNLLKNAISYSTPGTEIRVNLTEHADDLTVTISNRGKTIPKEKLARIFDKFYRLDEARSTNTGGAGLGLAIAKKIVLLHGGSITADSIDGVTTFTVVLPRE